MRPELFLVGAGGFASDFVACFRTEYTIAGCWDDQLNKATLFNGIAVLGSIDDLMQSEKIMSLVITIANPAVRHLISEKLRISKHHFPAVIHPAASLFDVDAIRVGKGSIIFPSAIITTQVELGDFTVLHIGTSVHHNVTIGDCTVLMPGARITGDVVIGKNVFIGPNQTLSHGEKIGDDERIVKALH
jgi:sugar O-acyltransferase (sialic acid O-acetyltransferase NeuD family)